MPVKIKQGATLEEEAIGGQQTQVQVPVDTKVVQPTATITHQHTKDKGKTIVSESVTQVPAGGLVEVPKGSPMVGYEAARVHTDGHYGSFKVAVSLQWPCVADPQHLEEVYQFIRDWVNNKLVTELKEGGLEVQE